MNQEKLIAEITDDQIRYVIYEQQKESEYKILKKKISKNIGIKKGKILDFDYTAKKINNDLSVNKLGSKPIDNFFSLKISLGILFGIVIILNISPL